MSAFMFLKITEGSGGPGITIPIPFSGHERAYQTARVLLHDYLLSVPKMLAGRFYFIYETDSGNILFAGQLATYFHQFKFSELKFPIGPEPENIFLSHGEPPD